jgi:hypothetical protein
MDIIDEFPKLKGFFTVMGNAPIHILETIDKKSVSSSLFTRNQFYWAVLGHFGGEGQAE